MRTTATAVCGPATAACSTPGCGGGPTGAGEFAIFSLNTGIQVVGEGNYGRLGTEQQQRYTTANAETQFSEPATGGTPDEQPGAMPEIMPSITPGTDDVRHAAEHRPLLDLPLHVHAGLGPLRDLLGGRAPGARHPAEPGAALARGRAAAGRRRVARVGVDVRLAGCGGRHASRDGSAYTTKVDAAGVPGLETLWVGHMLPRDATLASVSSTARR